jgi:hypothetical protein
MEETTPERRLDGSGGDARRLCCDGERERMSKWLASSRSYTFIIFFLFITFFI